MFGRVWTWCVSWFRPPDPARSEGFLETQKWALDYNPSRAEDDYALALEYGQTRYEEMLELSNSLDKKLDDVARTSLAIGVIIATVSKTLGAETTLGHTFWLFPAVFGFAWSILVAVLSRNPTLFRTPIEIRDLLKVMDDHPDLSANQVKALMTSSFHVAIVGTYATNAWKAKQLWRASFFLIVGIALLIAVFLTSSPPRTPERSGEPSKKLSQNPRPPSFVT